jgi:uncharacterized membrane protein YccC
MSINERITDLTSNLDRYMSTMDELLRRAIEALRPGATQAERNELRQALEQYVSRNDEQDESDTQQDAGGGDR